MKKNKIEALNQEGNWVPTSKDGWKSTDKSLEFVNQNGVVRYYLNPRTGNIQAFRSAQTSIDKMKPMFKGPKKV